MPQTLVELSPTPASPASEPTIANGTKPDPKLKHRPKSLNLSEPNSNNSDVALKIISPGLPSLNAEMQSTVKISQKIELQQRHLIAARQSGNPASSSSSGADSTTDETIENDRSDQKDDLNIRTTSISTLINQDDPSPVRSRSPSPTLLHETIQPLEKNIQPLEKNIQPLQKNIQPLEKNVHPLEDLDSLNTPTTAKRLKRNNIPTPLAIGAASQYARPTIQSAPIRQSARLQYPLASRQAQFSQRRPIQPPLPPQGVTPTRMSHNPQHQALLQKQQTQQYQQHPQLVYAPSQYHPSPHQQYYTAPGQRRQYRPFPNAQVTYLTLPSLQPYPPPPSGQLPHQPTTPFKRSRIIAPYTTTSPYFPRGIRRNVSNGEPPVATLTATTKGKPYSVTDVYRGDYKMAAPINSQPLSAQKEYFNQKEKNPADDDRLPVSEEEMKEMQEKYNSNSEERPSSRPAPLQFVNQQQSLQPQPPYNRMDTLMRREIFGSINLMNESIFNFKIFNAANGPSKDEPEDEPEDQHEDDDDDVIEVTEVSNQKKETSVPEIELKEESDTTDTTGAPSSLPKLSSSASSTKNPALDNRDLEWLAKEKEKFLKICETSWDEFVNSNK